MANINVVNIFKDINSESIKDSFENTYIDYLIEKFEDSPNYKAVYKNLDYTTTYKTQIVEYDTGKNLTGYKRVVSYPYDTQTFTNGDYISFTYGGSLSHWLIFATDKQFDYNLNGKIKRCNNTIKWKDIDGNTLSYPCVIDDKINNSDLDQSMHIIVPEGGIVVYLQLNEYTNNIEINNRFLFGTQAWKVNAKIDYVSTTFMTLILQKDAISDNDDFVNMIAYNSLTNYTLNIYQDNFTQSIGYTTTLSAIVKLNGNTVSENVIWESSNNSIATVGSNGELELLSTGSVVITSSMEDNEDISDSITITVNAVLPSNEEIIISPNTTSINQGQTETYTVYAYIDGVVQPHIFTISGNGVPTDNYTLTTTDNGFSITNIQAYTNSALTITCINQTTSEVKTIDINLIGWW